MHGIRAAAISSFVSLSILALFSIPSVADTAESGLLKVVFLDVGQGDSIFIESPSGTQVLIDGGRGSQVLPELSETLGFFDETIDMVVATHPDADHIGGLIDVLEAYTVEHILMTENAQDTPVYEAFVRAIEREGATVRYARAGQIYDLGESVSLRILFPYEDPSRLKSNDSSIIAQLAYGETEYLLTGDAPSSVEAQLVSDRGDLLESEVLKLGHHGSKTSTSDAFTASVAPFFGIISAGKDNSYGHPHASVIETLERHGVRALSTAEEGTIVSFSDGNEVWFE